MQLSTTLITALRSLLSGESIASSRLRRDVTSRLLDEGLLAVTSHGSRRTLRAIDTAKLRLFLDSDEQLRDFALAERLAEGYRLTRAELAANTGNSKLTHVRACPGFPVGTLEPIDCRLNGRPLTIAPQEGTFLFITDWEQFTIPADVIVVGIENMENFRFLGRQRQLLTAATGGARLLAVSRYPQSTDLRSWLLSIGNRYLHFGDFDLAGVSIFLNEFYRHLGDRASFLIPADIKERLRNGSRERYNAQYRRYVNLKVDHRPTLAAIRLLIDAIHHHRRCYDQEGYIDR